MCDLLDHAETLRRLAGLPRLLVASSSSARGGARADIPSDCTPGPTITLGVEALDEPPLVRLATLAHEIAHHALGHPGKTIAYVLAYAQRGALAGVLLAAGMGAWSMVAACLVLALAVRLVNDATYRADEYAADAHALALLDRAGFNGETAMTAMFTADIVRDPWWHVAGGWVLSGHPPVHARARRLADIPR